MAGTLAGALEARQIAAYGGSLETEVEGDIEEGENKVLLLTKVHIKYKLQIPKGKRRAGRAFPGATPFAMSGIAVRGTGHSGRMECRDHRGMTYGQSAGSTCLMPTV